MNRPGMRWWILMGVVGTVAFPAAAGMVVRRWGTAPRGGPAAKVAVPQAKPPTAYIVKTDRPPRLDGRLDDAVWKRAGVLYLARTLDGASSAAVNTEVRLLLHKRTLYVAVRAAEPLVNKLVVSRRGHDGAIWDDDSIEIFLGTGGVYYHFGINAVGSTYDGRRKDASWNSGFVAKAGRGEGQWTVEAAIPLAKLAGKTPDGKLPVEWIANFNRTRRTTGAVQEFAWSPTCTGNSHVPSRFGKLLLKPPPKERRRGPARPARPTVKKKAVEILPAANGLGVVRFDLSQLPRGTRIYRADLLVFRTARIDGRMDQAMEDVEVYPQFRPFAAGGKGVIAEKPLAIRGPWFDRLDATEAVRAWVAGKPNGGFFVKSCPFWNAEATCLDVYYQGTPRDVPKQVTGLKAFHRAGQTFITWKEITDPIGRDEVAWGRMKAALENLDRNGRLRYCVYRHSRRITAENIHQAKLIAVVKPLSCWNVNGRSLGRAIDRYIATAEGVLTGHWSPWWQARMDGKYGVDCPIDRLVIRDGAQPLPRGTGLYVHTVGTVTGGRRLYPAYYAVVTSLDGVQNTRDITAANSLRKPVEEVEGIGEPVLQRVLPEMPFFNYPQKRLHYVRWVAPPLVNVPSQYYNWSVGVPEKLGKSVPLELNLHRDGYSYWRTHYRIERDSIVLAPHDFPIKTFWYGYHESLGTLRSFRQGRVQPYTERRLLAFIEWACRKWPVDRNRILVTGCRGGASGSGALFLGLRHPELFNLVIAGHPILNYAVAAQATDRRNVATARAMQAVWGRVDWNLPGEDGQPFWPRTDAVKLVEALPAGTDLPFVAMTSSGGSAHRFYRAMLAKHHGIMGYYAWGGTRYLPVSNTGTFPNVIRLDIRKNKSYLAVADPAGAEKTVKGTNSAFNTELRWKDIADAPDRYEVTTFVAGRGRPVASVTLRRLQRFKVVKGKTYQWRNDTTDAKGKELVQQGEVKPDADGLLTIPGVRFGGRLVIAAK